MEIIISNNANKPIYEQINSQIKAMIMSGKLQPGEAIPSMRALAKAIHVLSLIHIFGENITVLQTQVVLLIEKTLFLHTGHV